MRLLTVGEPVSALTFSPDGATLATASRGGLRFWDAAGGGMRLCLVCAGDLPAYLPLSYAPDGRALAFSRVYLDLSAAPTDGRTVSLGETPLRSWTFPGYWGAIAYNRDHRRCARLTRWSLEVRSVRSRRLLVSLTNTDNRRWPVGSWFGDGCASLTLAPDGGLVGAAFHTDDVVVFDLRRRRVAGRLWHPDRVGRVLFSPDGALLATATAATRVVRLWGAADRKERARLPGLRKKVTALAFSPDGRFLAVGSDDGSVRLWDVAGAREAARYDWEVGGVGALAFAPDGQRAAAGGKDGQVVVWDVDL
jgi:WD40 repeat protein